MGRYNSCLEKCKMSQDYLISALCFPHKPALCVAKVTQKHDCSEICFDSAVVALGKCNYTTALCS